MADDVMFLENPENVNIKTSDVFNECNAYILTIKVYNLSTPTSAAMNKQSSLEQQQWMSVLLAKRFNHTLHY